MLVVERTDYGEVILSHRLRDALARVNRALWRHGNPPDKQEEATQTMLEQAALLSAGCAAV